MFILFMFMFISLGQEPVDIRVPEVWKILHSPYAKLILLPISTFLNENN